MISDHRPPRARSPVHTPRRRPTAAHRDTHAGTLRASRHCASRRRPDHSTLPALSAPPYPARLWPSALRASRHADTSHAPRHLRLAPASAPLRGTRAIGATAPCATVAQCPPRLEPTPIHRTLRAICVSRQRPQPKPYARRHPAVAHCDTHAGTLRFAPAPCAQRHLRLAPRPQPKPYARRHPAAAHCDTHAGTLRLAPAPCAQRHLRPAPTRPGKEYSENRSNS